PDPPPLVPPAASVPSPVPVPPDPIPPDPVPPPAVVPPLPLPELLVPPPLVGIAPDPALPNCLLVEPEPPQAPRASMVAIAAVRMVTRNAPLWMWIVFITPSDGI
ncbi:hypothetical protein EOS_41340, partial [Caballeronia mineralivorans PML1(12)]